jgi:DNA replication protein DnaC
MSQVQLTKSTSQNTQASYKCQACKDTGWINVNNGYIQCDCVKREIIQKRWTRFGVDPGDVKQLKEYKINLPIRQQAREKAFNYITQFETIRTQRNSSIAFLGQPGAGKTHLSLAIGKALLERESHVEVVYFPYLEASRELKANVLDDETYNKIQSKYINAELLIIDDLFKDKVKKGKLVAGLTETDMKHIYPIINQRYINHLPTIYSSECNANMLMDLDEALGGRIIESCKDNFIIFKYGRENNYRLEGI